MAELLDFSNPFSMLLMEEGVAELLKTNRETCSRGLMLSAKDATEIIENQNEVLQSCGRIELSTHVLQKLTLAVSCSPFVSRESFAPTIHEFVELFYYAKNETLDKVSDDELIELMKDYYDHSCYGSIELLQSRELENLIRAVRSGLPLPKRTNGYDGIDGYDAREDRDDEFEDESEDY